MKWLACALLTTLAMGPDRPAPLLGFDEGQAVLQRDIERRFDERVRPENLRAWMKRLAARPHHVGSPWGRQNADFIADRFCYQGHHWRGHRAAESLPLLGVGAGQHEVFWEAADPLDLMDRELPPLGRMRNRGNPRMTVRSAARWTRFIRIRPH